jgi:hypothetical protein
VGTKLVDPQLGPSTTLRIVVRNHTNCVISGFPRGVNELFVLLGFYEAWIGSLLPTFRDNLSVPFEESSGPIRMPRTPLCYQTSLLPYPSYLLHAPVTILANIKVILVPTSAYTIPYTTANLSVPGIFLGLYDLLKWDRLLIPQRR